MLQHASYLRATTQHITTPPDPFYESYSTPVNPPPRKQQLHRIHISFQQNNNHLHQLQPVASQSNRHISESQLQQYLLPLQAEYPSLSPHRIRSQQAAFDESPKYTKQQKRKLTPSSDAANSSFSSLKRGIVLTQKPTAQTVATKPAQQKTLIVTNSSSFYPPRLPISSSQQDHCDFQVAHEEPTYLQQLQSAPTLRANQLLLIPRVTDSPEQVDDTFSPIKPLFTRPSTAAASKNYSSPFKQVANTSSSSSTFYSKFENLQEQLDQYNSNQQLSFYSGEQSSKLQLNKLPKKRVIVGRSLSRKSSSSSSSSQDSLDNMKAKIHLSGTFSNVDYAATTKALLESLSKTLETQKQVKITNDSTMTSAATATTAHSSGFGNISLRQRLNSTGNTSNSATSIKKANISSAFHNKNVLKRHHLVKNIQDISHFEKIKRSQTFQLVYSQNSDSTTTNHKSHSKQWQSKTNQAKQEQYQKRSHSILKNVHISTALNQQVEVVHVFQ